MAPSSALTTHLRELVEASAGKLPHTWKRMFGCDAAFVDGKIFALIWKTGRIGLKLPERERLDALLALDGAEPWTPGGMKAMSSWVLVPESLHDDTDSLTDWVREAHAEIRRWEPKAKKKPAAKPRTKAPPPAKKKAPARKR